ncbi:MAG TPA: flagellar biosynthetic protein FliR [Acidimicrobiales bacterium]|nr:flagellar biosynthetic protein FliR [Acidimicrobiales bacterium]
MALSVSVAAVTAFFLALVRGTAFLFVSPPFTLGSIPFIARTAIAGGIALAAVPELVHDPMPASTPGLIGALAVQAVVGGLIGLVVLFFVGAIQSAGNLLDQFSGLNLPPALDPLSLEQSPVIGQLYEWVATVLLFSSGGAALILHGFLESFSVVGTTIPAHDVAELPAFLASDIVSFFGAAVEIAAPLVAVIFVAQVLLAMLAKTAPQANVYLLGQPLQMLLALLVLGISITALPSDLASLLQRGLSQLFG